VFGRLPVEPWRFDAVACRSATAHSAGRPLSGEPVASPWDQELAEDMRPTGHAAEEEGVLDELLDDLATDSS
jgi:hypothetical protein